MRARIRDPDTGYQVQVQSTSKQDVGKPVMHSHIGDEMTYDDNYVST